MLLKFYVSLDFEVSLTTELSGTANNEYFRTEYFTCDQAAEQPLLKGRPRDRARCKQSFEAGQGKDPLDRGALPGRETGEQTRCQQPAGADAEMMEKRLRNFKDQGRRISLRVFAR